MNPLTALHVAGGAVALLAGTVAIAARKGGAWHRRFGVGFCVAMFVLGVTAAVLGPFATPVQSPVGGIMVCYFVATAWLAAARRQAAPGLAEKIACALVLTLAALIAYAGVVALQGPPGRIPGPVPLLLLAGFCALAGTGDLRLLRRGTLTPRQRIARHLWRMCFAFFIATGSFFLGQMDVLPPSLRWLPGLLVLAFAPFAVMAYALVRNRLTGYPLPRRRLAASG